MINNNITLRDLNSLQFKNQDLALTVKGNQLRIALRRGY